MTLWKLSRLRRGYRRYLGWSIPVYCLQSYVTMKIFLYLWGPLDRMTPREVNVVIFRDFWAADIMVLLGILLYIRLCFAEKKYARRFSREEKGQEFRGLVELLFNLPKDQLPRKVWPDGFRVVSDGFTRKSSVASWAVHLGATSKIDVVRLHWNHNPGARFSFGEDIEFSRRSLNQHDWPALAERTGLGVADFQLTRARVVADSAKISESALSRADYPLHGEERGLSRTEPPRK